MTRSLLVSLPLLLLPGLGAQELIETFPVDGPGGPAGVTAPNRAWGGVDGALITDGAPIWAFLTVDGYKPTNGVIDIEAGYFEAGVQFAGSAMRFTTPKDVLMCKIQENTAVTLDFDRSFIAERSGRTTSVWRELKTKVSKRCLVRFIVLDDRTWMMHDFDQDGTFDQTITYTATKVLKAGLIGVSIFGLSEIHSFEFHPAVLMAAPNARPKVGTTYTMELRATQASARWITGLALGNSGFAIGERRIPLDLDPLFATALQLRGALGLEGTTDARGAATVGFRIPNLPALVDATVYAAAFTLDATRPFGVGDISNELAIKLE